MIGTFIATKCYASNGRGFCAHGTTCVAVATADQWVSSKLLGVGNTACAFVRSEPQQRCFT